MASGDQLPILVASATATTGSATVKALSDLGVPVRAMVRKLDDPRSSALAALPHVTTVAGDFDDLTTIEPLFEGIKRCMLVTDAFSYEQFERETLFIEAASKAGGIECVLRISTASFLIKPGTKGAYGRAHHGIEAFVEAGNYSNVIHINPNWYLTNWMGNADEAKSNGTISMPTDGNGPKDVHMLDPRDVGEACAAILTLSSEDLKPLLAKRRIEVHGPAPQNFADVAEALGRAAGYTIRVNKVPRDAYIQVMLGVGLKRVFCTSLVETIEQLEGVVPPGYEHLGEDMGRSKWNLSETSPELLKHWKPKYTVDDWAGSEAVMAAFKRD